MIAQGLPSLKNELLPTKIEVDQHMAMNPPVMQISIQKKGKED